MPTVHAEVDTKTKVAVIKAAKEEKVSPSVIIRWALDAYLQGRERASQSSKEVVSA